MPTSPADKVRALLYKTVERGCTVEEEDTAVKLALVIIGREGLSARAFEFPIRFTVDGVRMPPGQTRAPTRTQEPPRPRQKQAWKESPMSREEEELARRFKEAMDEAIRRAKREHEYTKERQKQHSSSQQGSTRRWKTIGELISAMVVLVDDRGRCRYTYEDVLLNVRKHFPDAKTTEASIRWYETQLRKQGVNVPLGRGHSKGG